MTPDNVQLHSTDTVYATVSLPGGTLVRLTLSGFASISDLMKSICGRLKGVAGLVTVEIRNSTVGWLERRSVRLRSVPRSTVQLTLF